MHIYYVYAYIRSKDGTPYYIGKGKGSRAYNKRHSVSVPLDATKIVFLEKNLSEVGALALERRYIRWFGRKDLGTGILYNKTDGGDGSGGLSADAIQRIRSARLGTKLSDEIKKKISESNKGKHNHYGRAHSDEFKLKMSKRNMGNQHAAGSTRSDEFKEHLSKMKRGVPKSAETKARMLEAQRNRPTLTCPHCGKQGKAGNIHRYHFDNCKHQ